MKKLIAIALLYIHLFNLGGYQVLCQYFIYQSDKVMNEHISKNMYNIHDLVEVKLPVNLPNMISWTSYVPISGQIQFKQACYNYVKLRLTRDTMYVMCIPNYEKTRLLNTNIICAKQLEDLPLTKHNNLPSVKKSGLDIYRLETFTYHILNQLSNLNTYHLFPVSTAKSGLQETPYLPPDLFC